MQLIVRRLSLAVPTLLALSFLIFIMLELTPGDAISALMDDAVDASAREVMRAEMGLDHDLLNRYTAYLGRLLTGDLGESVRTGRPVAEEIGRRLPYTLTLAATSITLALIIGTTLGIMAVHLRGTIWDTAITGAISISMAIPTYWVALILVSIFALQLHWLPVFGADSPRHFILPTICVALALIPSIARMTRSGILETYRQPFVTVARAKGLSGHHIMMRHIRPAAAIPVVTVVGLQAAHLIGSLVTMEVVFTLPGLGGLAVQAALDRDPLLLSGVTLCIAALTFGVLLATDLIIMWLDPRISHQQQVT